MADHKYSLKFTPKADEDLEQIYKHISETLAVQETAWSLLEKIENKIMRLKQFPYSCELVQEEALMARGYRKLIIDNYIAFYKVDDLEEQVVIMRILYGAQNYLGIL